MTQAQAWTATILVADDEQDIRELVAFKLEQLGFEVHAESMRKVGARNRGEAVEMATEKGWL